MRPHRPLTPFLVLAIVGIGGVACASTGESARRDTTVLTQEEIQDVRVSNLYEAVERLRPRWLQVRSPRSFNTETEVVVFMNRSFLGGPEILRQFGTTSVLRIRYLDGPTASATLGGMSGRHVEGAIILETGG